MAEALIGAPVISAVINPLIPIAYEKMRHVWGVRTEMKKLHGFLKKIQAVLIDAENKQQEEGGEAVKIWLEELRDVAYDAEDVLDEFSYESLQRKMEIQGRMQNKVKTDIFLPLNNLAFRFRMSHKIRELNRRMDGIARESALLGLNASITSPTTNYNGFRNRETSSQVDSSKIVGRELEKSKIINLLVKNSSSNDEETCSVVRIVGMGGVGKTALAQSIFNDRSVTDHFDKNKLWIYVPHNSDKKEIFGKILESMKKKCDFSTLDLILNEIKENSQGKRYLIVLDDLWNAQNNEWDDILEQLRCIFSTETKVILTTRLVEAFSSTSSYTYCLETLSEDESWSLFEKIAFQPGGVEKRSDLIEICKNISKKCGGLPLAVKIIGGLLSKIDGVQWQSIARSGIWELPEGEQKVIRILKLSYDYLEPNLKRCFSYCSLFPKGHIIEKKKLIRLWMAEGFLNSCNTNKEMEKIGSEYFEVLLTNTFFQEEQKDPFGSTELCRMHDLLHDLALSVSRPEYCSMLDVHKIPLEFEVNRLRHVCFNFANEMSSNASEAMYEIKNLRTFISSSAILINDTYAGKVLRNFSCLRVLDLSDSAVIDLPSSVGKLKHLRYLDLSNSQVTNLPDSLTSLYNLQTLILENCFKLKGLPRNMKKLINLRHLIICNTGDQDWIPPMPSKVGSLICLRSLPRFTVGNKTDGYGIEELRDLSHLGGELVLHHLENVSDGKDAEAGCLKDKQYIRELGLIWSNTESCSSDAARDDFEVLEGLQPHQNLIAFRICNYMGSKFSTWMMNMNNLLPNLTHIDLVNCTKCDHLPSLGLLRHLENLYIWGLDALETIGSEFYGGNNSHASSFPSLRGLHIFRMVNLKEWSDHGSSSSDFPVLDELFVYNCPKLRITPTRFPSLKRLVYTHSNGVPIRSLVDSNLASLTSVEIEECEELVFLPRGLVRGNNILGKLTVIDCKNFKGFESSDGPMAMRVLTWSLARVVLWSISIKKFEILHSRAWLLFLAQVTIRLSQILEEKEQVLSLPNNSLVQLSWFTSFARCMELESFPFPVADIEEGNLKGHYFPSLLILGIVGWPKLNCLPEHIQYLKSLKYLHIGFFGSLEAVPEWLGNLASLSELVLRHCGNLKHMPSREQMLRLTSLEKLVIVRCPSLVDRCKPGGQEYNKISHIPMVEFKE